MRLDREVVGARFADRPEHLARVESGAHKQLGEVREQLRVGGRVAGPDVIQGLDDSAAQQVAPHPVHVTGSKIAVVGGRHPSRQLFPARRLGVQRFFHGVGELGGCDFAGAIVFHLACRVFLDDLKERFCAFDRRPAEFASVAGGVFLEAELREIGRRLVILILGPALEGMVVAFVAVEPRGEEKMRRVFQGLRRLAQGLPVTGGGIVLVGAAGGHDVPHELVVGHVLFERRPDPAAEPLGALFPEELGVYLKQIAPFVGPVLHEIDAAHQLIHQRLAFDAAFPRIRQKTAQLFGGRGQPGKIQGDAPHKLVVRAEVGGQHLHAFPLGGHELVDRPPCLGFLPFKPVAVSHDRHRGGGVVPLVSGQQRGFSPAQGAHQAGAIHTGHVRIAGLHKRLVRHIPRRAIRVMRDHPHLLARSDLLDDRILRGELNPGHPGRVHVQRAPCGDPLADNLVVIVVRHHPPTALVRHFRDGLEQDEAVVRGGRCHPA